MSKDLYPDNAMFPTHPPTNPFPVNPFAARPPLNPYPTIPASPFQPINPSTLVPPFNTNPSIPTSPFVQPGYEAIVSAILAGKVGITKVSFNKNEQLDLNLINDLLNKRGSSLFLTMDTSPYYSRPRTLMRGVEYYDIRDRRLPERIYQYMSLSPGSLHISLP